MKKGLAFLLSLLVFAVMPAFPWGAVEFWSPTHQAILVQAYTFLSNDPAFQGSGFLPLASILEHEGVKVASDMVMDFQGYGNGPDAENATPYSWHYYNPLTGKGLAPGAVRMFYKELIDPNQKNNRAKPAAWSAHFLADMSVPYHIVGMLKNEAIAYMRNNIRILPENIAGPLFLYDSVSSGIQPVDGWGKNHDFWYATVNFVNNHASETVDWYDPWYANGSGVWQSHRVGTSSHVQWEKAAHSKYLNCGYTGIVPSETGWYNPSWKNAAPNSNFNMNIVEAQAAAAALFTHEVALFTRNNMAHIHKNPETGIFHAMRNVATLWRSTFTALRPAMFFHEKISNDANEYGLECRIANRAGAPANNVQVKLYVFYNQAVVHTDQLPGGTIPMGGTGSVRFRVKVQPGTEFGIVMAVVAQYDIPDLQYAVSNATFRSKPAERTTDDPVTGHDPFAGILGAWEFGRNKKDRIGTVILTKRPGKYGAYYIDGYAHANESYWKFYTGNSIVFLHENGSPTTYFKRLSGNYWEGRFLPPEDWPRIKNAIVHYLRR